MANAAQIRKIHAAAREVNLDDQDKRDLVERISGSRSISALSFAQAGEVLDALVALGARAGDGTKKPSGRRKARGEIQMITPGMRSLILELRHQLGSPWLRNDYYAGACKKVIRTAEPRTAAQGTKVIEMLKKRLAHDQALRNHTDGGTQ